MLKLENNKILSVKSLRKMKTPSLKHISLCKYEIILFRKQSY